MEKGVRSSSAAMSMTEFPASSISRSRFPSPDVQDLGDNRGAPMPISLPLLALAVAWRHFGVALGRQLAVLVGLAWRRKAIFCRPLYHELAIGRRLVFKLRFYFWISFFCSEPLELEGVLQIFGKQFHFFTADYH
jgi:hypothetical protein